MDSRACCFVGGPIPLFCLQIYRIDLPDTEYVTDPPKCFSFLYITNLQQFNKAMQMQRQCAYLAAYLLNCHTVVF